MLLFAMHQCDLLSPIQRFHPGLLRQHYLHRLLSAGAPYAAAGHLRAALWTLPGTNGMLRSALPPLVLQL
jgi:hypothetical protein